VSVTQTADTESVPVTPRTWLSSGTAAISLKAGQIFRIPAADASAAYPIDPLYVDVTLDDGFAQVLGKFAGHTEIIIVTDASVRNIPVDVTPAAPVYPPGFHLPESAADGPVIGTYEFRYMSDQPQIQNILDITTQSSDRSTQLHVLVSNLLAPQPGEAHLFLPSAFYDIKNPRWDLTLLDQSVTNSPLTVNGAVLRGVHFKSNRWLFHAGYASLATFNGFIFPVQPEGVVGASYVIPLSPYSRLTSSAYYFLASDQTLTTARPGAVPSVVYEYKQASGPFPVQRERQLELLAELAAGNGLGSALRLRYSTSRDDFILNFREKPRSFHSLSFDNVPGLQSELVWNRQLSSAVFNNVNFYDNQLLLPQSQQNNLTSSENLHARLSRNWSVGTGATYASFSQTGAAGAYSLASITLPQNINFDLPHFGVGLQYQYSRNSQGISAGQDIRPSVRASIGGFSASAYVERQTQATTVEQIFSANPTLQAELDALGLTLSAPQQLQSLLQDTTFLQALGLSPGAQLNLVPSQNQVGGNLNWNFPGGGTQQLNVGIVYTTDKSLLTTSQNWNLNGSYVRQLGRAYYLSFSASLLRLTVGGQPQTYPLLQIGLRRSFSSLPWFLSTHKFGTISGTVFQDDEGHGIFRKGLPAVPGVEVVLDGSERTTTDSNGFYSFTHISDGGHFIEFNFQSSKPFWFTGPSKRTATINIPANLGIRFASAELIGYIRNDAAIGIEGARIIIAGRTQRLEVRSDAQGRFSVPGLGAGDYQVNVDPDSLPGGYFLEDLKPQQISLQDGVPNRLDFHVRALRSLVGHVTVYNATVGQYVPAVGVTVELRGLSRQTTTNSSGTFILQDLPSGNFTVVLDWDGAEVIQDVTLAPEPGSTKLEIKLPPPRNLIVIEDEK
jgi:SdrD B-like protein